MSNPKIMLSLMIDIDNESTNSQYKKKKISQIIRAQVWDTYIGRKIGEILCPYCNVNTITQLNFECGHVIAESKGGEISLENLRPICNICNKSMGNKEMDLNLYDVNINDDMDIDMIECDVKLSNLNIDGKKTENNIISTTRNTEVKNAKKIDDLLSKIDIYNNINSLNFYKFINQLTIRNLKIIKNKSKTYLILINNQWNSVSEIEFLSKIYETIKNKTLKYIDELSNTSNNHRLVNYNINILNLKLQEINNMKFLERYLKKCEDSYILDDSMNNIKEDQKLPNEIIEIPNISNDFDCLDLILSKIKKISNFNSIEFKEEINPLIKTEVKFSIINNEPYVYSNNSWSVSDKTKVKNSISMIFKNVFQSYLDILSEKCFLELNDPKIIENIKFLNKKIEDSKNERILNIYYKSIEENPEFIMDNYPNPQKNEIYDYFIDEFLLITKNPKELVLRTRCCNLFIDEYYKNCSQKEAKSLADIFYKKIKDILIDKYSEILKNEGFYKGCKLKTNVHNVSIKILS